MTAWLLDTLLMTGVLMGFVLLIRKPVGRWFGPAAAYALWALPMIRLFLPPLVLPDAAIAPRPSLQFVPMPDEKLIVVSYPAEPTSALSMPVETQPASLFETLPWGQILLTVWLVGAALFLLRRFAAYHAMRAELLRGARRVGHSGKVRIVESPAVAAPLAFGVFDRVVALPAGFLATADSDASDFAIAHELEHHAGNDLVANFAVQPLFALHWFNPIGWMAWRALRSDQEAACDARVMAGRNRAERERYGRLIAEFAVGPRLALAAPMAGPLRGDKPIIHRLKALVRNDVSERRKLLGRSLFAMAVIGVPATATVTYAAVESDEVSPNLTTVNADRAHAPRRPVLEACPKDASDADCSAIVNRAPARVDHETDAYRSAPVAPHDPISDAHVEAEAALAERQSALAMRDADWAEAEADRAERNADRAERDADRAERDAERRAREQERRAARIEHEAERLAAEAERRAMRVDARAQAAALAPSVEQTVSRDGKVQTIRMVSRDSSGKTRSLHRMVIDSSCPAGSRSHARSNDGRGSSTSYICSGVPESSGYARAALIQARAAVAAIPNLPAHARAEALADIDREMAQVETD